MLGILLRKLMILTSMMGLCAVQTIFWSIAVNRSLWGQCNSSMCINNNAFFGTNAGISNSTGNYNSFFGINTGFVNTTGNHNSFFGDGVGLSNTSGSENSFFGASTGSANTTGINNSFFGGSAGLKNTTGTRNSFFGRSAGIFNTVGSYNVFLGESSGYLNTSGNYNVFVGYSAGYSNINGTDNSFFGRNSGYANTSGNYNSFFGASAGAFNSTGSYNTFFGQTAGISNTTGGYNAFFGIGAGTNNTIGGYNTFVGPFAGGALATGLSNICLGVNAGPSSVNSAVNNRLYIDVETKDDPLIYGEFDNDYVKINGTFEVRGGLSNPSSALLKEQFEPVSAAAILAKLSEIQIEEWSYSHTPEVRHLGPTAESFYSAFRLGADPQKINTIDADGISLISIQALYEEVIILKKDNEEQHSLIKSLQERIFALEQETKVRRSSRRTRKIQAGNYLISD